MNAPLEANVKDDSIRPESLSAGEKGVFFRPVRNTANGTLAAFYCVPAYRTTGGELKCGDEILLEGSRSKSLESEKLAHNIAWTLSRSERFLKSCRRRGQKRKVIVPVNALALTLRDVASEFTSRCRAMEEDLRDDLIIEAFNFPANLNLSVLDDVAIILYPFTEVYLARPNMGFEDFVVFTNCNFQGVCADLENKPWPVTKVQPYLDDFVENAGNNRLTTYLHGAANSEIVTAANEAGIGFIDGDAISS